MRFFRFWGDSETLGFGLSDIFHFQGGVGYSETLGFGLSDNFHFWRGEVFWNSRIWTLWQFLLGGCSKTLGFGLSDNFHFWGGYSETVLQNRGYSGRIWTKISTTPAGSCITDSLSHVETNKLQGNYETEYAHMCGSVHLYYHFLTSIPIHPKDEGKCECQAFS